MVLAAIWENRIRRQAREPGRQEANQLWLAWNRRRMAAEERGEPFHEPPPVSPADGS